MEKKKEKVINYEREYPKLVSELEEKIESTTDPALLDEYYRQVFFLENKMSQINFFKFICEDDFQLESYTRDSWGVVPKDGSTVPYLDTAGDSVIDESAKREDFDALFDYANLSTFGGFDYYYLVDLNKMMDRRINDQKRSVNMLINSDQLKKLQNVVDSMGSISFISYVGKNGEDRYAILQDGTPLYINLIPFTRNEKGRMELDGVLYRTTSKESEYNGFPYRVLDRKRRV